MSKHLRFKNLLGALAIMLTLGMSWGQASAQNLSSEKEMMTFALAGQVSSVINADRTIDVVFPFGANVTALVGTFTSSEFSNVYVGVNPSVGTAAVSGVGPATDYSSPVVWTVEAENHSYDNYTVTVAFEAPATGKDLLSFAADWTKDLPGACLVPGTETGNAAGTFAGTAVSFMVPFGTDLTAVTVDLAVSPLATVSPADAAVVDFTAPVVFTVTAQNGTTQTYTVTAVVGQASHLDNLDSFTVAGAN